MLCALLLGTPRRMQWVGEQQKGCGSVRVFSAKHAGHSSTVRVAAQIYLPAHHTLQRGHGILQPGTISGGVRWSRRSEGSRLTIRQIAAQNRIACAGECLSQSPEQRCLRITARAMRQNEPAAVRRIRRMQESDDMRLNGAVSEFSDGVGQGNILEQHKKSRRSVCDQLLRSRLELLKQRRPARC